MTNVEVGSRPRTAPAPAARNPHHSRRWLILAVLGLAQLMVILDASIVNIALPSAQEALGFSIDDRQWVVTAYALAFGALLPLGGRVGDLIGRKTALIAGLAGFAVVSAIGGAASGLGMLVFARAAQGVFGALLAPAVLSLLTTTFTDAKERAKAFGVYGALSGAGGAIGLLAGGLLTEYLNWRWCMYVNIVFALVAVVGAALLLHNQRAGGRGHRIDIPGTVTVSAGLFAVVYGFANAETDGFDTAGTWAWLAAGVLLLALFAVIETRVAHPLIPMRILLDRVRGGAVIAVLLTGVGMFAVFLFLTFYLQQNLGFSPVRSGVAFLPMVFALATTATVSSTALLPRTGPRPLVPAGFLTGAAGLLWMAQIDVSSTYLTDVLGPLIVTGIGFGLAMAPSMTAGTSGVEPHDAGVASAVVNTAQQVGGSIGTAVLSTVAAGAMTGFLAGKQPGPQVLADAAVHSYTAAFTWAAAVFAAGAVICGLLLRSGPLETNQDGAPAAHL